MVSVSAETVVGRNRVLAHIVHSNCELLCTCLTQVHSNYVVFLYNKYVLCDAWWQAAELARLCIGDILAIFTILKFSFAQLESSKC